MRREGAAGVAAEGGETRGDREDKGADMERVGVGCGPDMGEELGRPPPLLDSSLTFFLPSSVDGARNEEVE
jgi:hypothetical protein